MKLSKKMVSLICLSFTLMIIITSSGSNIGDNFNLSSIENIDKSITTVIKSEEEKNGEGVLTNNDMTTYDLSESDTDENNINDKNSEELLEEVNKNSDEEIEESIVSDTKAEVVYIRSDITTVSGITKEELEEVLLTYKGASTMAHLADALVDAENEYGVNALAMAGIVALESGFATSRRAVEDNNLTGYEVYSDDSQGRLFSSQYESIMQTAKHLSKNYLKEDGAYYNGLSVDAVQIYYCPDKSYNWHNKVDMLASGFLKVYKEINNNKN